MLALFHAAGPLAWLWVWALVSLFTIVLMFVAPTWLMPLFNKFSPLPEGELRTRLVAYAERNGFPLKDISVMDGSKRSKRTNAFLSGASHHLPDRQFAPFFEKKGAQRNFFAAPPAPTTRSPLRSNGLGSRLNRRVRVHSRPDSPQANPSGNVDFWVQDIFRVARMQRSGIRGVRPGMGEFRDAHFPPMVEPWALCVMPSARGGEARANGAVHTRP
jgi:hypothetical protein